VTGGDALQGAHLHWDQQWQLAVGREPWSTPEPSVLRTLELLRVRGARRVLDLGCGVGRHALLFAGAGLECHAVDLSWTGLAELRGQARGRRLPVVPVFADFASLPYQAGSFDYVLAWNVIYHGDAGRVGRAISEIARVLRPGGLYQSTMLSKRNAQYGAGIEVSAGTFVQPDGPGDKRYPHYYSDMDDVVALHPQFGLLTAAHEMDAEPASYHWHLLFRSHGSDSSDCSGGQEELPR
jgi:SAM-dependent methyltransferase